MKMTKIPSNNNKLQNFALRMNAFALRILIDTSISNIMIFLLFPFNAVHEILYK
jgi:hypothetical protein